MPQLSKTLQRRLQRKIELCELDEFSDLIFANSAECYAMVCQGRDSYSAIGNTRFGGEPDLPEGIPWPATGEHENPLTRFSNFIAQINFAELPPLNSPTGLPARGWLFLFVEFMECAAKPVIVNGIFYGGQAERLRRTAPPDVNRMASESLLNLKPMRVRANREISLASYRKEFKAQAGWGRCQVPDDERWLRLLDEELSQPKQIGQILGYANSRDARDDLYRHLVLSRLDKRNCVYADYWESLEEYEEEVRSFNGERYKAEFEAKREAVMWLHAHQKMLATMTAEWQLLFQLNSNGYMDLCMMDHDPLYIFVREEDLQKQRFADLTGEVTQG